MNVFSCLKNMNILLIDDDEWIRDAMRIFFETENCKIIALETAEEAL
jgi:DNA-binding response OmpR family regulator